MQNYNNEYPLLASSNGQEITANTYALLWECKCFGLQLRGHNYKCRSLHTGRPVRRTEPFHGALDSR